MQVLLYSALLLAAAPADAEFVSSTRRSANAVCRHGRFNDPSLTAGLRLDKLSEYSTHTTLFVLGEQWQATLLSDTEAATARSLGDRWRRGKEILEHEPVDPEPAEALIDGAWEGINSLFNATNDTARKVELLKQYFVATHTSTTSGSIRALIEIGHAYANDARGREASSFYRCGLRLVLNKVHGANDPLHDEIVKALASTPQTSTGPLVDACFPTLPLCEDDISKAFRPAAVSPRAMRGWYIGAGLGVAAAGSLIAAGGWMEHRLDTLQTRADALAVTKDTSPDARDEYSDVEKEIQALQGRPPWFWAPGAALGVLSVTALTAALIVDCRNRILCRTDKSGDGREARVQVQPWVSRNLVGFSVRY